MNSERELVVSAGNANVFGLVFFIPVLIFLGLPYFLIWTNDYTFRGFREAMGTPGAESQSSMQFIYGILIIVGSIVLHELIHGFSWALFSKNGWKDISFGVIWKYLTPYCHCKSPLKAKYYRLGAAMPGIIIGIVPSITAMVIGDKGLLLFGMLFTFAAGGDFLIIWLLRKESNDTWVQDHPKKMGCVVYS